MTLTIEFFIGLILIFVIGFTIAAVFERIFHINLDESEIDNLNLSKAKKHE
jgi:hypothetical protein